MKKFILPILILVTALYPTMIFASKKNDVLVAINDNLIEFNGAKGKSMNDTIYVPLREFAQALGVTVEWNDETKYIGLNKEEKGAYLDSKNKVLTKVGEETIPYDMVEENGTTYIPARTLAEYFDYQVEYMTKEKVLRVVDNSATLSDKEFQEKYRAEIEKHNAKVIYLTFDDGPNDYTLEILDLLAEYNMKATFFMLDSRMKSRPEVVERIINEGHAVGLHGVSHEKDIFYTGINTPLNEMNTANSTLEELTGKRSALVRMPYGSVPYLTTGQYNALTNYGYRVWDWHVDSRDWASKNTDVTYQSVVNQIKDTQEEMPVVLFHDRKTTVGVIKKVLAWMNENSYTSEGITKDMQPKTFKKIK
ncbi:MAG: polysaccharide deacetylase family protein [Cellulosilyticaceae bacterium]